MSVAVSAPCPECEAQVKLAPDVEKGEIVQCAECAAELEVFSTSPMELRLAPPEEEDWGQ